MPRSKQSQQREKERKEKDARSSRFANREIGVIPKVAKPKRRKQCERDLLKFCLTYFPSRFPLPFSDDHRLVISHLQACILDGGQFALAMPRSSGKTTICEVAVLFSMLFGHRRFVVLIGASEDHATEMLDAIKTEIETNERLAEDFPEVCYPVAALERVANRAKGQLHDGKPTWIAWQKKVITFASINGSKASGATLRVTGITGRIRGMKHARPDGVSVRPDLVIVDDPQTDESAASEAQNRQREKILAGAVLGLAGPGKQIAAVMPCTVIEPGDMADAILDRDKHPEWNGIRCKLMYAEPTNEKLWEEYNRIRREALQKGEGLKPATDYYIANRAEMDAGARPAWEHRYKASEASAIQHAMNLRLTNEDSYLAEYQNTPRRSVDAGVIRPLVADEIAGRLTLLPRGTVPLESTRLTAFIDVGDVLYWLVVAWDERFGGAVIDYGTWPEQPRTYFRAADGRTLGAVYSKKNTTEAIYAGLSDLCGSILGRTWPRHESEETLGIDRCLIDAGWGESTETVYQFCRQSPFRQIVMPSHGRYIGAVSKPMESYRVGPGDRLGLNWLMLAPAPPRRQRHVTFDTNFWKSFVASRLTAADGAAGGLRLFGDRPTIHQLLADHCLAEYRVATSGRGRNVEEWKLRPNKPDNHWWDCLVGCAVGASVQGLLWSADGTTPTPRPRVRVKLSELQARKQREAVG